MIDTNTILSSVNNTVNLPNYSNSTGAVDNAFAALLQEKQAASASTTTDKNKAPTLSAFMAATGVDFSTAAHLVSGVVGANTDYRDWSAIMASKDPLSATKQATNDLFFGANAPSQAEDLKTAGYKPVDPKQIVAQSGNIAMVDNGAGDYHYTLMRNDGYSMGGVGAGDAQGLLSLMDSYGVDKSNLSGLADQLDAKGIAYQPGKLYEGSNHGIDLRNLAQGGMGTSYDWRTDNNATRKDNGLIDTGVNNFAADAITQAQAIAANLAIKTTNLSQTITLPNIVSTNTTSNAATTNTTAATDTNAVTANNTVATNTNTTTTNVATTATTPVDTSKPTVATDLLAQLNDQVTQWSQKITTQGSVSMTQFLNNYSQLQSLLAKMDQVKMGLTL